MQVTWPIIFILFLSKHCLALQSFGPTNSFNQEGAIVTNNFQAFDYVNPNAPKQGEIRLAASGNFNNLNPFILAGINPAGISYTYETLGMQSFDQANTVYGLIAESFEYNKKNNLFIVNLRKNVKFHDGSLMTANDVMATYHILLKHGHPLYQQVFKEIVDVQIIDPYTLRFKIQEKDASNDLAFKIASIPVLSEKDIKERDFEKTTLKPLIGTGPYRVKDFKIGQKIQYTRDKNYWASALPIHRGRYNFDSIVFKYFKDEHIALTAFKAHRYDWREENIAKFWATQYKGKAFKKGLVCQENIKNESPNGMQAFVMNIRKPLFKDRKVRKALNLAFDFQWLNENLFYSSYVRANSFYSNSQYAASTPISHDEKKLLHPFRNSLPKEIWETPYSDNKQPLYQNLIKAQELLDQTDWVLDGRMRVNKKTQQPFEFVLLINSPAMKKVALPFKRALKKIGITMHIQLISPSNWISRMKQFDYDMTTYSWPAPNHPGSEQFFYWNSQLANTPGSSNIIGINNPAIDAISTSIKQTEDHQSLVTQMKALDRILMWHYFVIPHWYIGYDRVAYWKCLSPPIKHPKLGIDLASWYQRYDCSTEKTLASN